MKNSKFVFFTLAVLISIGVLTVAFQGNGDVSADGTKQLQNEGPSKDIPKVGSNISLSKTDFDFGDIPIHGGKVSTTFNITNEGNEPVTLTKVTTSCMCTDATIDGKKFGLHMDPVANIVLAPQSSKEVTVTFDPLAHGDKGTGPVTRVVAITTNSTTTPQLMFKFAGNVVSQE